MPVDETSIKSHPVWVYFILTLIISWGGLLFIMGPAAMLGAAEVPAGKMPLLYAAMLLGPSLAGLLMIGLAEGRAGFGALMTRLRRWRASLFWYGTAILTAPALATLTLLVLSRFSTSYSPAILTSGDRGAVLGSGLLAGVLVGIFEELGWTGFAIPHVRPRHGMLATGLIVGLVWGLWHAPLFVSSARASLRVPPVVTLLVLLFSFLPAFRVLMVWVYDHTQSLPLAMLMHASQTATTLIFALSATDVEAVVFNLIYTALVWCFIVIAVLPSSRNRATSAVGQRQAA